MMHELLCFSQGWILGFALGFIPTMAWAIVRLRQATAHYRAAAKAYNEAQEFRSQARAEAKYWFEHAVPQHGARTWP